MKRYENLEDAMCRELESLDKKYAGEAELSAQDVEKIDKLYHALKSAATYHAMKDAEWEDKDASGRSYRRGRDAMGRYVSRDMGYSGYDGRGESYGRPYPMYPDGGRWY